MAIQRGLEERLAARQAASPSHTRAAGGGVLLDPLAAASHVQAREKALATIGTVATMGRKQRRAVYRKLLKSHGPQAVRDLKQDVAEYQRRLVAQSPSA